MADAVGTPHREGSEKKTGSAVRVPVWLAAVVAAAVLGWTGSWIGYSTHSGATVDSRVSVLETKAEAAETDRKETLDRVKRIEDMVTWLVSQGAYRYQPPARSAAPRAPRNAAQEVGP